MPGHSAVDLLTETRYGTVVENTSLYGTPIERSTSPLQLGCSTEPNSATPGTTPGSDEEIYAAAPEEMLGWTKPRDVMSIYEDVGRPNVMPNVDGNVYARGTPNNSTIPTATHHTETPYGTHAPVSTVVWRELSTAGMNSEVRGNHTEPPYGVPMPAGNDAPINSLRADTYGVAALTDAQVPPASDTGTKPLACCVVPVLVVVGTMQ